MTVFSKQRSDLTTRIRLFASSYAPLFVLLALRFNGIVLRSVLGAVAGVFLIDTLRIVVFVPRRVGVNPLTIKTISDEGGQVAGYLATYLLPFLVLPSPSPTDLVAYALFLIIAGVVTVRSNLTFINPTLYLFGYRLVSITTREGFAGFAILKSSLKENDVIHEINLGTHIVVEVRK